MPTAKPLVYWPSSHLKSETNTISKFNEETLALATNLVDSMFIWGGVGLAAPQIGSSASIFVINQELEDGGDLIKWGGEESGLKGAWVLINPQIVMLHPGEPITGLEGCLSFPDIFLQVKRQRDVVIEAYNVAGGKFFITAKDFLARVIQHEFEHLLGQTMLEGFSPMKKKMVTKKVRKWRKKHGVG